MHPPEDDSSAGCGRAKLGGPHLVLIPGRRRFSVAISVVIVGGGLMGLSTAWHLRREDPGAQVTVLERREVGAAASGASAAGLRAIGPDPAERPLARASPARCPHLTRPLGHPTGCRRGGGLRVALAHDAWREAPAWVAEQRADGVALEPLDAAAARAVARR